MSNQALEPTMRDCIRAMVQAHRKTTALDPARLAHKITDLVPVAHWVPSPAMIEDEIIRIAIAEGQPLRLERSQAA